MRRLPLGLWLFLAFGLAPIAMSLVWAALYSVGLVGLLSEGFTFEHWSRTLGSGEIWSSVGISLWAAAATVTASGALGITLALVFRERLDRGPLSFSVYLPLALPGTVAAFFVFQLLTASGLVNRLGLALGLLDSLDGAPALVHDAWAAGVVVTHTLLATPFLALLFRGIYRSERVERLSELAASLGATPRQRLLRVILPVLIRRGAATLALIFLVVVGSYEVPLLLGRQTPAMLSVLVMRKYARFDLLEKPAALAVALVYSALVFLVLVVLFRRRATIEELGS